ncbi:hypothetical protein CSB08_00335 [Candidatus Gracilibacteria bacterium]|nr:MAG: hypothetical protein CSB08_00335 [Candidatus Gracilibacteria bacterium]
MSNRLMGILILFGFALVIVAFYLYFYKYNRINIEINSNLPNYEVELYSMDTKSTFKKTCKEKKCIFKDFSPFNYKIKVTKKGYRDFNYKLNIRDNGKTNLDVLLEKNIYLSEIKEKKKKTQKKYDLNQTKEVKIEELRERKLIKRTIILDNLGKFVFKKNGEKLELILNGEKSLGLFENGETETLNVRKIEYTNDFVFINIGEKKYIYNLASKNFYNINLFIPIKYIKTGENNTDFRIVTEKGTFIFSTTNSKLKYFTLFKDYEIVGDNYIGIIYKDEKEKFDNYSIDKNGENLIVKLGLKIPNINILIKEKTNISKILKTKNQKGKDRIIIVFDNGKKYELMNF